MSEAQAKSIEPHFEAAALLQRFAEGDTSLHSSHVRGAVSRLEGFVADRHIQDPHARITRIYPSIAHPR